MSDAILAALITGAFALAGTIVSIAISQRTLYNKLDKQSEVADTKIQGEIAVIKAEISALREETHKHNGLIERTYKLEQDYAVLNERVNHNQGRIEELERMGVK